jgi:hypothetical protein
VGQAATIGHVHQGLFGRYHVAEPPRFEILHHGAEATALKEISHDIPIPVLDQEDLIAQGIDTSQLVKGAPKVDALGSCTANATTVSLAEHYVSSGRGLPTGFSASDPVADEEWAIDFYHSCTDQTGDPGQEWPPTDAGSTGLYCCQLLQHMGLIKSYSTGNSAMQALSMLQHGTVIWGTPWFNSWMSPNSDGFVDGDGSFRAFMDCIRSGVAGGHEICMFGVPKLGHVTLGHILDLEETVIDIRNSWSTGWGENGTFRIHASTVQRLAMYADLKQFVLA